MGTPAPGYSELTLSNLCEGNLEEQFQRALEQVAEILENAEQFERNKDRVIRAQIVLEIDLERRDEDSFVSTDVRYKVKGPKRLRIGRAVHYARGQFRVTDLTQGSLFGQEPARVRALRTPPEEDDR